MLLIIILQEEILHIAQVENLQEPIAQAAALEVQVHHDHQVAAPDHQVAVVDLQEEVLGLQVVVDAADNNLGI